MWLFSLFLVMMIGYFLARMAGFLVAGYFPDVVISPRAPKNISASAGDMRQQEIDIEAIIRRNFFDSEESSFAKGGPVSTVPVTKETDDDESDKTPKNMDAVRTKLDVHLISTVAVGDGRNKLSSCVLQTGRANEVYTVSAFPSFAPETKITRIMPKKVEFLNQGVLEYVDLVDYAKGMKPSKPERITSLDKNKSRRVLEKPEDDKPAEDTGEIAREGNNFTIPKAEVDKALANLSRLYTDIRAVPYFKNGKANGFKLINVRGGSLFEKLGLRRGDILKSINGTVLDIQSGMNTFNNLKNESSFTMEVERRGVEQAFNYQIM